MKSGNIFSIGRNSCIKYYLVGGFNPPEKYQSNWIISRGKGENNTYILRPPPSHLSPFTSKKIRVWAVFFLHAILHHVVRSQWIRLPKIVFGTLIQGIVGYSWMYYQRTPMGNPCISPIQWVSTGHNPQESLESTINTIVLWLMFVVCVGRYTVHFSGKQTRSFGTMAL